MPATKVTRGRATAGAFVVGSGGANVKGFKRGTVAVDPASIAGTTKLGTAVTITGVAVGDAVHMIPPSALEDDLVPAGAVVTGANTVTLYLYNGSGVAVDGISRTWEYLWWDLT